MYDKSLKGPFLYLRHGETEYNKISQNRPSKQIMMCEDYIDSSLSEEGKMQAEELGKRLLDVNIKYVYCSPLNRCLETSMIALKNHPDGKNIKVFVHPLIAEVVHGAQDIPEKIEKKKKIYNENSEIIYDWKYFDEFCQNFSNFRFYFTKYIDGNDECSNEIIKRIVSDPEKEGVYEELLKYFIVNNKRPESLHHLFKRSQSFKEFLRNTEHDGNVLVVTHSAFIRMSTTEIGISIPKIEGYPADCYYPDNCEIITINI